jgi:hypothetical protein
VHTFSKHPRATSLTVIAALGLVACGDSNAKAPIPSALHVCESLQDKTIGGAAVTAARMVDATANTPAHCKVSATIAPSLAVELDLPAYD